MPAKKKVKPKPRTKKTPKVHKVKSAKQEMLRCPACDAEIASNQFGELISVNGSELIMEAKMAPRIRCGSCRTNVTLLEGRT